MDVWGLILSGVGAVVLAIGQEIVAGVTARWLRAHEIILGSLVTRGDADRISGIDDQMDRAAAQNRLLSRIGWSLFVTGIILQIVPHFAHDGWHALCEPLFSLCRAN